MMVQDIMPTDAEIFERAAALGTARRAFVMVTVVRTAGSTPRKAPAKMIVCDDGTTFGTVGGGRVEGEIVIAARDVIATGRPTLWKRHLGRDLAMCCGGEMEVFMDPQPAAETLVLVGGGHVNAAIAAAAAPLVFSIVVAEDLPELATPARFPAGTRVADSFHPGDWGVALGPRTYVVVATREHAVDEDVLIRLAAAGAEACAYVGVVGSRAKIARFRQRLEARDVPAAFRDRLRGPIGLDIGAQTPEEIAVAVAAELVAVRHGAGRRETDALRSPGAALPGRPG